MRRSVLFLTLGLTLATAINCPRVAFCDSPVGPGTQISLKDMLNKGLKSRRPEDFEYIDAVVLLVDLVVLPESMVRGTFFWARKKYRRPLQYFQQALYLQAKKVGIDAPSLASADTTAIVVKPGQPNR